MSVWYPSIKVLVQLLGFRALIAGGLGAVGEKTHKTDGSVTYGPYVSPFFWQVLCISDQGVLPHYRDARIRFKPSFCRNACLPLISPQIISQVIS